MHFIISILIVPQDREDTDLIMLILRPVWQK